MRLLSKHKITKIALVVSLLVAISGLANTGLASAISCADVPVSQQQQCSDSLSNAQAYCNGVSSDQQQQCSDSLAGCTSQQNASNYLGCLNNLNSAVQSGQTCPAGQDFAYNGSVLSCVNDTSQTAPSSTGSCTSNCTSGTGAGCVGPGVGSVGISDEACSNTGDPALTTNSQCDINSCSLVDKYVKPFIVLLSILVGVAAVLSLILGGIQYSTSAGDPQKTANAKNRITKTLMAVLAYAFLYAFIQFLIPGGIKF